MNSEHLHPEGRPFTKDEFVEKIKNDKNFANRFGNLGRIYGAQWRSWKNPSFPKISKEFSDICDGRTHIEVDCPIDQISELITQLKENPDSRRLMVNAWAVHDLPNMVLPPCHYGFQVYTRELSVDERIDYALSKNDFRFTDAIINQEDYEKYNIPTRAISLMWNQRSVDTFLGLPFNIASYGLLLEIIAKEVNMVPEELIGNLGDVHLYSNHVEQAKEQIGRELSTKEMCDLAGVDYDEVTKWSYHGKNIDRDLEVRTMLSDEDVQNIPTRTRRPFTLPKLMICDDMRRTDGFKVPFDELDHSLLKLIDYQSHPAIKAPLSN